LCHDVAPEYSDNIKEAVQICDVAERELLLCTHVSSRLPGNFNTACSTIFDGFYRDIYSGPENTWNEADSKQAGLPDNIAKEMVSVALSKRGTAEQRENGCHRKVLRRDYMSLEVTEVILPERERISKTDDKNLPENKYFRGVNALGILRVKPWVPEDPYEDEPPVLPPDQQDELEFWLEKSILQYCFVGMHLETRVYRFKDGLNYIDSVTVSIFLINPPPPIKLCIIYLVIGNY
jgi:hypothetical protein